MRRMIKGERVDPKAGIGMSEFVSDNMAMTFHTSATGATTLQISKNIHICTVWIQCFTLYIIAIMYPDLCFYTLVCHYAALLVTSKANKWLKELKFIVRRLVVMK